MQSVLQFDESCKDRGETCIKVVVPNVMSRPEHDIMLGQDSQSESENGTRHHVHTSRGKYSAYFLKG